MKKENSLYKFQQKIDYKMKQVAEKNSQIEDSTMYGEWVPSANSWQSIDRQRERVREIDAKMKKESSK